MRHALVSLIAASAAAAVSVSALAQETTTPQMTPPEATLPAPPPTIEPADPATSATPVTPAVPDMPTPEVAPAPAVEVPPAPPAPPPAPAVPTDPTTIRALHLLESLCKPMVQGGDFAALSKPQGFRKKRDAYVLTLAKPTTFTITPSAANPNLCRMEIAHPIGTDTALTVGVHDWAIARGYTLYRNDEFTTDLKRHTRSWELTRDGKTEALVLVTARKPDGSPVSRNADHSTLMFSVQ